MKEVICDYCGKPAELVSGDQIYRGDTYTHLKFWLCRPCGAHVGCHRKHPVFSPEGITPYGGLANAELRKLRNEIHEKLDPRWRNNIGPSARKSAYVWLAERMNIDERECHIGMFRENDCRRALLLINNMIKPSEMHLHGFNEFGEKPDEDTMECPICLKNVKKSGLKQHKENNPKCLKLQKEAKLTSPELIKRLDDKKAELGIDTRTNFIETCLRKSLDYLDAYGYDEFLKLPEKSQESIRQADWPESLEKCKCGADYERYVLLADHSPVMPVYLELICHSCENHVLIDSEGRKLQIEIK